MSSAGTRAPTPADGLSYPLRQADRDLIAAGARFVPLPPYAIGLGRWASRAARRQRGRPSGGGPDAGGPLGPKVDR